MAGGAGERFWPLSRASYPKQLLKLAGDRSMLSAAVERISPLVAPQDIYIITNRTLKPAIEREAAIPPENVIAEPEGKNTAACLALGTAVIQAGLEPGEEDAVTVVLTADHFIRDTDAFVNDCRRAAEFAETHEALVTFGIPPTRPDTGYGYIETGEPDPRDPGISKVGAFREKPNLETARQFLEQSSFFWNSGIFVWRNSVLKQAFAASMPQLHDQIEPMRMTFENPGGDAELAEIFAKFPKVSIDIGILEKARNVYVVKASFDWDDIGTWDSLRRLMDKDEKGNVCFGNSLAVDCEGTIVYSSSREVEAKPTLVVGYNLRDTILVHSGDAVLVLPAGSAQQVKDVVLYLRERGLLEYL